MNKLVKYINRGLAAFTVSLDLPRHLRSLASVITLCDWQTKHRY